MNETVTEKLKSGSQSRFLAGDSGKTCFGLQMGPEYIPRDTTRSLSTQALGLEDAFSRSHAPAPNNRTVISTGADG